MTGRAAFSGRRMLLGCILYLFCAFGFVNMTGIAMGMMPEYYDVPLNSVISSTSITTGVGIAAYFFNGPLYKRFSPRTVMIIGGVSILICTIAMAVPSFGGLIVYRIVAGFIGSSCVHTLTTAVCVRWYEKDVSSRIGIVVLFGVLGVSFFQLVSGWMFPVMGISKWYLIGGLVATAVTLLMAIFVIRSSPADLGQLPWGHDPSASVVTERKRSSMELTRILIRKPMFWLAGISMFLGGFAEVLFLSYGTAYLPMVGIPYTTAATCVSIFVLLGGLVGLISGKIIDKMGLKPFVILVYLSAAVACLIYILVGQDPSPLNVVLMVIFSGIAYPVMMINSFSCTPLFGAELSDDANGKLGMFLAAGCCIMNLVAAGIIENFGFQQVYLTFAIMEIAAMAIFLVALHKAKKEASKS